MYTLYKLASEPNCNQASLLRAAAILGSKKENPNGTPGASRVDTPLIAALKNANYDFVMMLLQFGASISCRSISSHDGSYRTATMLAIKAVKKDPRFDDLAVSWLSSGKAKIDQVVTVYVSDRLVGTLLGLAWEYNAPKTVNFLMSNLDKLPHGRYHSSGLGRRRVDVIPILHEAVKNVPEDKLIATLNILLDLLPNVNVNERYMTICSFSDDFVTLLLESKADILIRIGQSSELIKFLNRLVDTTSWDYKKVNYQGYDKLAISAIHVSDPLPMKFFLDLGLDPNRKIKSGQNSEMMIDDFIGFRTNPIKKLELDRYRAKLNGVTIAKKEPTPAQIDNCIYEAIDFAFRKSIKVYVVKTDEGELIFGDKGFTEQGETLYEIDPVQLRKACFDQIKRT